MAKSVDLVGVLKRVRLEIKTQEVNILKTELAIDDLHDTIERQRQNIIGYHEAIGREGQKLLEFAEQYEGLAAIVEEQFPYLKEVLENAKTDAE